MPTTTPKMTEVPRGIIQCPITPFTSENTLDLDLFGRGIEFLMKQGCDALCANLHVGESLNLTLDERQRLVEVAVEVAGAIPVIANVSTPGTDQAVTLARHAEKAGAACIMAISPYYWKPPVDALYEHFSAILSATGLPFIGYSSPTIMDGVGITPELLIRLMKAYPQFIGLKEASHNWETYIAIGKAGRSMNPDFGLFVGTEWIIPSLTLGGVACMSVQGGVAPGLVRDLYAAVVEGRLKEALPMQEKIATLYALGKGEYPAPTKAMWEIMGRPMGKPRLPNRPVSPERYKDIEQNLDALGILASEHHGW
ncbi:dihydrodipicolinate synthase family protein [Pseudochelatococcus sp. B33]